MKLQSTLPSNISKTTMLNGTTEKVEDPSNFMQVLKEDEAEDEGTMPKTSRCRDFVCTSSNQGIIFLVLFASIVPVLFYFFLIDRTIGDEVPTGTCLVDKAFRVSCGHKNISEKDCTKLSCCFEKDIIPYECYHYLPSKYYYEAKGDKYQAKINTTPWKTKSTENAYLQIDYVDEEIVTLRLTDSEPNTNSEPYSEAKYQVNKSSTTLMAEVFRVGSSVPILSTSKGPVIISQDYWEWTCYLGPGTLFGLGQLLIEVPVNTTLTRTIYPNSPEHSLTPQFFLYNTGNFHGIKITHEAPLELTVLPSKMLVLRTISGTWLQIELAVGPAPSNLHDQFLRVASPPPTPPSWLLEPQYCPQGTSTDLTKFLTEYSVNSDFKLECLHENLLMYLQTDQENQATLVATALQALTDSKSKFLLHISPHILASSTLADNLQVLYKVNETSAYTGQYLNEDVVFPDYSDTLISRVLEGFAKLVEDKLGWNQVSGLVLTKNWPQNDLKVKPRPDQFSYLPEELSNALIDGTIPWYLKTPKGQSHLIEHLSYARDFLQVWSSKSSVIMTSTGPTLEPAILVPDNLPISWTNLKSSLLRTLFYSATGAHLVAPPVCGSTSQYDKTFQELTCLRWYFIASTMPLLRVASQPPYRTPSDFDSVFYKRAVLGALAHRQVLLAHFYSLLLEGVPVLRPMWYDFYKDETTLKLDEQYMIGDNLLVAHPFTAGRSVLRLYLPPVVPTWYEYLGGLRYASGWIDFSIVPTDWIAFVAEGTIIVLQDEEQQWDLLVALNCNTTCGAEGRLRTAAAPQPIRLSAKSEQTIEIRSLNRVDITVREVRLFGAPSKPPQLCTVNEKIIPSDDGSVTITINPDNCNVI